MRWFYKKNDKKKACDKVEPPAPWPQPVIEEPEPPKPTAVTTRRSDIVKKSIEILNTLGKNGNYSDTFININKNFSEYQTRLTITIYIEEPIKVFEFTEIPPTRYNLSFSNPLQNVTIDRSGCWEDHIIKLYKQVKDLHEKEIERIKEENELRYKPVDDFGVFMKEEEYA